MSFPLAVMFTGIFLIIGVLFGHGNTPNRWDSVLRRKFFQKKKPPFFQGTKKIRPFGPRKISRFSAQSDPILTPVLVWSRIERSLSYFFTEAEFNDQASASLTDILHISSHSFNSNFRYLFLYSFDSFQYIQQKFLFIRLRVCT